MMQRVVVLVFCLNLVRGINIVKEHFLQLGELGFCNKQVTGEQSAFLKSHIGVGQYDGIVRYDANVNCHVEMQVDAGNQVLILPKMFELEVANDDVTCKDYITIDGGSQLCTNFVSQESAGNQVAVEFTSDSDNQNKGFILLLTSYHRGTCTNEEFLCDTDRCISASLTCDGFSHCVDGADEDKAKAGCTFLDTTLGSATSLGQYVVLAIGVLASAVILTVFIIIFIWKGIGSDTCCKCRTDDTDDVEAPAKEEKFLSQKRKPSIHATTSAGQRAPIKKKKSVTISTVGSNPPIPIVPIETETLPTISKGVKRSQKRQSVAPVLTADSEW